MGIIGWLIGLIPRLIVGCFLNIFMGFIIAIVFILLLLFGLYLTIDGAKLF